MLSGEGSNTNLEYFFFIWQDSNPRSITHWVNTRTLTYTPMGSYTHWWKTLLSTTCADKYYKINCLLCDVFSKRWLVYAAGTNSDDCARNYLCPVFLLTKTQPRGFYQWIFIKDTPLPDWQDDQAQEVGHAVY